MNRKSFATALIVGSLALAGAAAASDLRTTANAQPAEFLSAATILDQLGQQGYSGFTELELDDGKYELEGRDADGRKVEIDVDARTGAIIKVERD